MTRARQLIEGFDPDSPESFGLQQHLVSPIGRFAAKNGFTRSDKYSGEERWIKKLSNGNEAHLVSDASEDPRPVNLRRPDQEGGRMWNFLLAKKTNKCVWCQGRKVIGGPGDKCDICDGTGKQKKSYFEFQTMATASELAMDAVLGAIMQRLATWPKGRPKPGT